MVRPREVLTPHCLMFSELLGSGLSCLFALKERFARYYQIAGQLLQHEELQCHDLLGTERQIQEVTFNYAHKSACWDVLYILQECTARANPAGLGLPYPAIQTIRLSQL